MPINTLYPFLKFDWNEASEHQIEQIVNDKLLIYIVPIFHPSPDEVEIEQLRNALQNAVSSYINGALDRVGQKSEKEDNEVLEKVTDKAQQLYDELLSLMDHPTLEARIKKTIDGNPNIYRLPNTTTLSDMLAGDRNTFYHFREILVDLQVCVEDVINKKPKPNILEGFDGEEDIRLDTDDELALGIAEWRRKSTERRLAKDHALQEFLKSFRVYWVSFSPHPYTEGMHHSDQRQTISNAVDVVEAVMNRLDTAITRQKIVTAFKKLRTAI